MTEPKKKPHMLKDLKMTEISLVGHCIYCGSRDFDKPGTHPHTGKPCNHPGKLERLDAVRPLLDPATGLCKNCGENFHPGEACGDG